MRNKVHGMTGTRFYGIWSGMKTRCNNKYWTDYGGRGITYCEEWENFINFKNDMYLSYLDHVERYGEKQTSLDRKNVNGNYEPSNCVWATFEEQNNNKRINTPFIAISPKGEMYYRKSVMLFSREVNLTPWFIFESLNKRISNKRGWRFNYLSAEKRKYVESRLNEKQAKNLEVGSLFTIKQIRYKVLKLYINDEHVNVICKVNKKQANKKHYFSFVHDEILKGCIN